MSTTPLTDAINALTTYANETTGAGDTDLSSAVATLIAGFGGGGVAETWELINEVTLSDSSRTWTIDTDSDGESFSLKKIFVVFTAYHDTEGSTGNKNAQFGTNGYDFYGEVIRYTTWQNRCVFYYADATLPRKLALAFYQNDWSDAYNNFKPFALNTKANNSYLYFANPTGIVNAITNFSVQMSSGTDLMAGGSMKIYGIRN